MPQDCKKTQKEINELLEKAAGINKLDNSAKKQALIDKVIEGVVEKSRSEQNETVKEGDLIKCKDGKHIVVLEMRALEKEATIMIDGKVADVAFYGKSSFLNHLRNRSFYYYGKMNNGVIGYSQID